jgi:3-oxoacyl-[acyl-carrier protein] reductase
MKKIIITGASKGLGRLCANFYSKGNESLNKIVIIGRDIDRLNSVKKEGDNPSQILPLSCDFLELDKVAPTIHKAVEFLGDVDVVLHIAGGGLGLRDPFLDYGSIQKLLHLNLVAIFEINRIVAPLMMKRQSGNLVHVGSIAGKEAVASIGYNTAKAALTAYVRSFGNEMAKHNVIANGILPGAFTAPDNAMVRLQKNNPDAYNQFINERLPRKKMGEGSEIIHLIDFLASKNASMMCGSMVPIDAGEGHYY